MRTLIEPPSGKKISTKVRPVAHATQWTRALRFLRMKKPTWESCGEHGVTADLSDSNHEDFCRIPGTPAQPICVAAIGVNSLLENFLDMLRMRRSDLSWPTT
jgi:hypothetical protein